MTIETVAHLEVTDDRGASLDFHGKRLP